MNIFLIISKKHGSQKKAAKSLGVSTSIYSDWALGKKKPSIKNAENIKKNEGFSFDQIFKTLDDDNAR